LTSFIRSTRLHWHKGLIVIASNWIAANWPVLIQVDLSHEATNRAQPKINWEILDAIRQSASFALIGLMTLPPFLMMSSKPPSRRLRELRTNFERKVYLVINPVSFRWA